MKEVWSKGLKNHNRSTTGTQHRCLALLFWYPVGLSSSLFRCGPWLVPTFVLMKKRSKTHSKLYKTRRASPTPIPKEISEPGSISKHQSQTFSLKRGIPVAVPLASLRPSSPLLLPFLLSPPPPLSSPVFSFSPATFLFTSPPLPPPFLAPFLFQRPCLSSFPLETRSLLCSPGWLGTHSIAQAGLPHMMTLLSQFPHAGITGTRSSLGQSGTSRYSLGHASPRTCFSRYLSDHVYPWVLLLPGNNSFLSLVANCFGWAPVSLPPLTLQDSLHPGQPHLSVTLKWQLVGCDPE